MFTRNEALVFAWLAPFALLAQNDAHSSVKVNFAADSPVALVSADWGESRSSERGSAVVLNLNTALSLKNLSNRRIRAVTLLVQSQETTPGGRASVTKASLDIGPGDTFPLKVELRLLRPLQAGGPMVEMTLDGVLFDDLSFYGPNRLDSRRVMLAFEMEARRDRQFFLSILRTQGLDSLKRECLSSLARQAETPRLDVQLARGGRSTTIAADRELQFAFLRFPDSPVEPVAGMAHVAGGEARLPRLEVQNRSQRPVRYMEVGWLLKDSQGREFLAGSVPAKTPLSPGQKTEILQQNGLRFSEGGGMPVAIESMTGFVSQVEFADGSVWIPRRSSLSDPRLQRALAPSAEEQRLTNIYRKKGLGALVEELKRLENQASDSLR